MRFALSVCLSVYLSVCLFVCNDLLTGLCFLQKTNIIHHCRQW